MSADGDNKLPNEYAFSGWFKWSFPSP